MAAPSARPSGSLNGHIARVTGKSNYVDRESVDNIADGDTGTKWLCNDTAPWWAIYEMDEPVTVKEYVIAAANDSQERDPAAWSLAGSADGVDWTTLDTLSSQTFGSRYELRRFSVTQPVVDGVITHQPYKFFRLNVTTRRGGGSGVQMMQLSEWELLDGSQDPLPLAPVSLGLTGGPAAGFDIRTGVGFDGVRSLSYRGLIQAEVASSTSVLYEGLDIAIGAETQFSYSIFPVLDGPAYT